MDRLPVRAALLSVVVSLLVLLAASCGSDEDAEAGAEPVTGASELYRSYLELGTADLVARSELMVSRIRAGRFQDAQSPYASARVAYGQIEPAAEEFKKLDRRLDTAIGEVPPDRLGGFHQIEKVIWGKGSGAGLVPVANRFLVDVEELQRRVKTADLDPILIMNKANQTLADLSPALLGKQDPYSQGDMVDISANLEGVEAVFEAVKPLLAEKDPDLTRELEDRFEDAYEGVTNFGYPARAPELPRPSAPGTAFVLYGVRSDQEYRELKRQLDALARPLSQVPAVLLGE